MPPQKYAQQKEHYPDAKYPAHGLSIFRGATLEMFLAHSISPNIIEPRFQQSGDFLCTNFLRKARLSLHSHEGCYASFLNRIS
jgi:hypothetical protein